MIIHVLCNHQPQILATKNEKLTMEMNSLKDVNVQLQTQLHAQDSLGQDDADGASSLTSQVMLTI